MHKPLALGDVLFSGFATSAHVQSIPLIEPKCFMWGEPYNWSSSERCIVRVFQPQVFDMIYLDPTGTDPLGYYNQQDDPSKTAEWCLQQIQASDLTAGQGKIAIIIKGLGEESPAVDTGNPNCEPCGPTARTRFYRVEDTLTNIDPDTQYDTDTSEARSAKPYKHPLIINGGTRKDANGQPIPSVLKQWVVDFCTAYKDLQQLPEYAGVPDPERVIVDCEPMISPLPGRNLVVTMSVLPQSAW